MAACLPMSLQAQHAGVRIVGSSYGCFTADMAVCLYLVDFASYSYSRRNTRGVRIIANSYGCSTANVNDCYSQQFQKAIVAFKAQGGLFIASAGNSGTNNDKVSRFLSLCNWVCTIDSREKATIASQGPGWPLHCLSSTTMERCV